MAPILILMTSMFYKKDEQVRKRVYSASSARADTVIGDTHIVVLCHGKGLRGACSGMEVVAHF